MVDLAREGRPFALATVVRTHGSTPQVVGAKLLVTEADARGKAAGTLGGGCVEADAIIAARKILRDGGRSIQAHELTEDLAWNTGLVCGGTMWILVERGDEALGGAALQGPREALGGPRMADVLQHAADGGPPVAIATMLRRAGRELSFAGRIFVGVEGQVSGTLGDGELDRRAAALSIEHLPHATPRAVTLDDQHDLLIDPVAGRPQLVVAGGGHVALAIARQAALLDFDVTILEDRPEFADPDRFSGARVIQGDVPAAIAAFDYSWSSFIVIATRGHKLDADCVRAAITTPARYIGLLGSRRKTVLIEKMLREEGVDDARIAAIHAPVGLDLGGRTPSEIALSVLAEITARRYQATGQPLRMRL